MIEIKVKNTEVYFIDFESTNESGIIVNNIPQPEMIEGKTAILHYSEEKGFWYEYVDMVVEEQPIPTQTQTNADIEQLRQSAYMSESNPILMAYNQYELLGETEKANAKKTEWIEKVNEIRNRYPYI